MNLPEEYHKAEEFTFRGATEMLKDLEGTIKWSKNEKILDIGCGPGNITVGCLLPFLPKNATIAGCDISKEMITYANSNFENARVSFKEMDIESPEIWDTWTKSSFTKLFSFHLIHWLDNFRQATENMYALLKPEGEMFHLYFADNPIINILNEQRNEEPWKKFIKGKSFFKWYSENSLEERKMAFLEELKRAGFEEIEMKIKDSEYWFTLCQENMDLCKSIDPYRKYIPDDLLIEYDVALARKLIEKLYIDLEGGRAKLNYSTNAIRAKKLCKALSVKL